MPRYQYRVKKGPGAPETGVVEAENQRVAVARLRDMGYIPIAVEEYAGDGQAPTANLFKRVGLKDRNVFFRQLANLYESGMPLTRAFSTLIEQTANPKMAAVIRQLRDDVQQGSTFADALEQHSKIFSSMVCSLVRAGETGGMLDEVLWRIVAFGEQEEELKGKTISALIYPAFLMLMGGIALFIIISFVFPKFTSVFEDFQAALPWPTVAVMALCTFMGRFWWAVLAVLGLVILAVVSYVRTPQGRMQLDTLILRIPVLGGVVQKYAMAQFSRTLGTLLENGVPVLGALRITVATLSNQAVAQELGGVQERVAEGDSISSGLRNTQNFTAIVVNMFAVGEESGRLGDVTRRLADAYDIEVDRAVRAMTALFEPIMIVVMGAIIGFLVIAMLLPMLTLSATAI
jgi:type II secretory pathway component PulF